MSFRFVRAFFDDRHEEYAFDLKLDEKHVPLGMWTCFGVCGERPVHLDSAGNVVFVNSDASLDWKYPTDIRRRAIKPAERITIGGRKFRIKKVSTLAKLGERTMHPAYVRVTFVWTQDPDADRADRFMFDVGIDARRMILSDKLWFGSCQEQNDVFPCLISPGGEIAFDNTQTVIPCTYSSNLLEREMRPGQYVAVWSEADRQGEEYGFEVTTVAILGKGEVH